MSTPYNPTNGGSMFISPGKGSDSFSTESNISRMLPRQMSSGSTRGTQTVGYGNTKIDGSNNVITVGDSILLDGGNNVITVKNADGSSVGLGSVPGFPGEFGFFSLNSSGQLVMKIVNGTTYMLDPTEGSIVRLEIGLLPDGTYNLATSKPGQDLTTAFS